MRVGHSIPASVFKSKGASEDELTRVPTLALTTDFIAEYTAKSGQVDCECALCLDVLQPGDEVALATGGAVILMRPVYFISHSPYKKNRLEHENAATARG